MGDDGKVVTLATGAIAGLDLSPEVRTGLHAIQAELTAAYQKNFVEMIETMRRQASALDRLQTTLNLLIQHVAPQVKDRIPVGVVPVESLDDSDLPSAVVIADPIAAGYTFTQANLAEALGVTTGVISELVRLFKLDQDDSAVTVRKGKQRNTVNYHPRALERLKDFVDAARKNPPKNLNPNQRGALKRAMEVFGQPSQETLKPKK